MQRLVILAALAACGQPTPAEMAKSNANAQEQYARDVEAIGAKLDGRFEPEREQRTTRGNSPQEHQGQLFHVEGGRVAHSVTVPNDCSGESVSSSYFYARRGAGVLIVVVSPDLHVGTVHVKGSCAMSGCGTQPPPPPDQLAWLPVAELAAVTVETKTVRLEQQRMTCDRPSYPP